MKRNQNKEYRIAAGMIHDLNQTIDRSHQETIQTDALLDARKFAAKNLPAPTEKEILPFITPLTGKYAALKKDVSSKLKGGLQKFMGSIGIAALTQRITNTAHAIVTECQAIGNLETDKERITINGINTTYKKMIWVLALFGIAESLFHVSAFTHIGDILLISVFVGIVIGCAQVIAVKTITLSIREMADPVKQRRYYLIALICFALFSVGLGSLRYFLAHKGTAASIPFYILNPFFFAAVNMLFVIGSALLVHFYFPMKAEMGKLELLASIEKDIRERKKRVKELNELHEDLVQQKAFAIQYHGALIFDEQKLLEKIDSCYLAAIGVFTNENVAKRTDGQFPDCYRTALAQLPGTGVEHFNLKEKQPV